MKKFLVFFSALTISIAGYSQTPTFEKSDLVFNAGFGIGTSLYTGLGYKMSIPPISISGEYGVVNNLFDVDDLNLGVGGFFGIASSKYEYSGWTGVPSGFKYSYTVIGVRGGLHYPLVDKLDTYGGIMLGANIVNAKHYGDNSFFGNNNYSAATSGLAFSIYAGARYYFTNNFAVMGELGYGFAYLNLGIALKI